MRNSDALTEELYAAALRAIAANNIGTVGKDGRHRVVVEWVVAQGALANLLRSIGGGEIPMHDAQCAARLSPVAECDCALLPAISGLRSAIAQVRSTSEQPNVNEMAQDEAENSGIAQDG